MPCKNCRQDNLMMLQCMHKYKQFRKGDKVKFSWSHEQPPNRDATVIGKKRGTFAILLHIEGSANTPICARAIEKVKGEGKHEPV